VGTLAYPERHLESMASQYSALQPIEPGDVCCSCQNDCDGEGFSQSLGSATAYAHRIFGHPICARLGCYQAKWDEYKNQRSGCHCGRRNPVR
jgi:hypothetical protein